MTDFPETRDSLIEQVRTLENREAWEQFSRIYRPVIYRLACRRGFQDADAQDLAQKVLLQITRAIGRWEKTEEGKFRHWLSKVVRNAILNVLSRQPADQGTGRSSVQELLSNLADPDPATQADLEREHRRELFVRASRVVQRDVLPSSWRAFEMTVVEGVSIEQAAALLETTPGCIYAARSRIMKRLNQAVQELEP